jgi:hypothetical protein
MKTPLPSLTWISANNKVTRFDHQPVMVLSNVIKSVKDNAARTNQDRKAEKTILQRIESAIIHNGAFELIRRDSIAG